MRTIDTTNYAVDTRPIRRCSCPHVRMCLNRPFLYGMCVCIGNLNCGHVRVPSISVCWSRYHHAWTHTILRWKINVFQRVRAHVSLYLYTHTQTWELEFVCVNACRRCLPIGLIRRKYDKRRLHVRVWCDVVWYRDNIRAYKPQRDLHMNTYCGSIRMFLCVCVFVVLILWLLFCHNRSMFVRWFTPTSTTVSFRFYRFF